MKHVFFGFLALGLMLSPMGLAKADYTFITLDVPGSTGTYPGGINASGQIVGSYGDAGRQGHGFLLDVDGSYTTIDVPGSIYSSANGINDAGQIVGFYVDDVDFTSHGFLLDVAGSYTSLDVPGSSGPMPMGSTPPARSWDGTVTLATTATAFCLTEMAPIPRSTRPARSGLGPLGSTTPARSWDLGIMVTPIPWASCGT
jgi:uncharacterized membrane protein